MATHFKCPKCGGDVGGMNALEGRPRPVAENVLAQTLMGLCPACQAAIITTRVTQIRFERTIAYTDQATVAMVKGDLGLLASLEGGASGGPTPTGKQGKPGTAGRAPTEGE